MSAKYDALIFADDDCDGVMSARITELAEQSQNNKCLISFQQWHTFGITDDDVKKISKEIKMHNLKKLYVLDLGSGSDMFEKLTRIHKEFPKLEIYVFDNHPEPDTEELSSISKKYNIEIYSRNDNCTSGLLYLYFREKGITNYWMELYALMGIHGDVANQSGQGKEIYEELYKKHPELAGKKVYSVHTNDSGWERRGYDFISSIVQFYHIPKRISYDVGTTIAYNSLLELEQADDVFELLNPNTKYPSVMKMQDYMKQWQDRTNGWTRVFKGENSLTIEYDDYTLTIIRDVWNIGSAVCNVKSSDFKKSAFAINLNTPDYVVVHGRNPHPRPEDRNVVNIGETLRRMGTELQADGGGLQDAGSAKLSKSVKLSKVISSLNRNIVLLLGGDNSARD